MVNSWISKFISPSKLDNYVKYLSGYKWQFGDKFELYTTEDFINSLLRLEDPSKFTTADAGTAVHELIELANYGYHIDQYTAINGWTVVIPENVNLELEVPVVREAVVKGTIAGIDISGRVDSMDGVCVRDIKTTKQYEVEKYMLSNQWKCYCMMTGLNKFVYDVFTTRTDADNKIVTIVNYHKIELYTYPGMEEEVTRLVSDYKDMLVTLRPMIVTRVEEYNAQIDELISNVDSCKSWAYTGIRCIETFSKEMKIKKISIEGLTDEDNP